MSQNTYLKRRTIKSGEFVDVIIKDINYINESTIGILIDVAEDNYLMKLPTYKNLQIYDSFDIVFDKENDIINKSISLVFNDKMTACGFEKDEYNIDIEYIKDTDKLKSNKSRKSAINTISTLIEYNESQIYDNGGWELYINEIVNVTDDKFDLKVLTEYNNELKWNIDIPLTTNKDTSIVARLIEEEGGGDPMQLEDMGRIICIHKSNIYNNLDIIGYDTTREWALTVPSVYENWTPETKDTQTNVHPSKKSTGTFSIPNLFKHMTFGGIIYLMNNVYMRPILVNSSAEQEYIDLAVNMLDMVSSMILLIPLVMLPIVLLKLSVE